MYGGQPVYHNHPVAHPSHLPPMHNHPPNAGNTSGGHHSNSTSQSSLAQHSHPPSSPPNSRRSVESEQSFRAHQVHHQVRSPLLSTWDQLVDFFPFIQVQQAARLPVLSEGDPGEDEPLIPPRTSSRPAAVIVPAQQQPQLHHQHPLAMNNSRFGTPPRSLLAMDVTQRMSQTPLQRHQLQHQMSEPVFSGPPEEPPPPAPSGASAGGMVAPLPSHVNQRRVVEAVVRTNPRLRHQHSHPAPHHAHPQQQVPQYQMPFYHHQRATLQEIMQQRQQQMQLQQQQQQQLRHHQHPMQRFHSEESLASRGGVYDGHHGGLYSSRIHSSADEISSLNRSPSMTSDDDQSLDDDGAAGGGEESEVRSGAASEDASDPPSRPPSHAPWMYPSDIRIDPSSLETSPKAERAAAAAEANGGEAGGASRQQPPQRLPTLGQSPSPAPAQSRQKQLRQQRAPPNAAAEPAVSWLGISMVNIKYRLFSSDGVRGGERVGL